MPELRHLRCFVAAAEELNFTRAAARLHIVQQSLSGTIKQLEVELGVQLFFRSTREVRLTAAGEAFLPGARRVLEEADRATAAVSVYAATRDLAIGFSFTLDDGTRWRLLGPFLSEHGMTRVSVHTGYSTDLLDQVAAGDLDLAVALCPEERDGIELARVMDVSACVVMGAGHPAAGRTSLRLADLHDEVFVLAAEPQGRGFNRWLMKVCAEAGFQPKTVPSPPVPMSFPIQERGPGAIALGPLLPLWESTGNAVRPLDPEVTIPYGAAIRANATGFGRVAFQAVVASGPDVAEFLRVEDDQANLTGP